MDNNTFNDRSDLGPSCRISPHPMFRGIMTPFPPFLEWYCHQTCGRPSRYSRAGGTAAEQPFRTSLRHPCSPVRRRALRSQACLDQQDYHSASIVYKGVPIGAVVRLRVDVRPVPCMRSDSGYGAAPQAIAPASGAVATQVLAHHTPVICGMAYWLDQDDLRKMQSGCLEGLAVSLATPLSADAMGQSATWIYTPRQDEMAPMRRY